MTAPHNEPKLPTAHARPTRLGFPPSARPAPAGAEASSSRHPNGRRRLPRAWALTLLPWPLLLALALQGATAGPLAEGDPAPDFSLTSVTGEAVSLASLLEATPVVFVMLRGYPGYQCPICSRQVAGFMARRDDFQALGYPVLFVYPGPAADLDLRALEFAGDRTWPELYKLLPDPEFTVTRAYGLRWNAPNETAYPATLVIDQQQVVRFADVSDSRGGRVPARRLLRILADLPVASGTDGERAPAR